MFDQITLHIPWQFNTQCVGALLQHLQFTLVIGQTKIHPQSPRQPGLQVGKVELECRQAHPATDHQAAIRSTYFIETAKQRLLPHGLAGHAVQVIYADQVQALETIETGSGLIRQMLQSNVKSAQPFFPGGMTKCIQQM